MPYRNRTAIQKADRPKIMASLGRKLAAKMAPPEPDDDPLRLADMARQIDLAMAKKPEPKP